MTLECHGQQPRPYEVIDTGILRDKTMDDKLMYIHNDETQNYPAVD